MTTDRTTKALLTVIAAGLVVMVCQRYIAPPAVSAAPAAPSVYVEPGVKMLRAPDGSKQVYGKVMVDLRTGDIWGFPTYQADAVYPVNALSNTPPVSHPFKLGRFAVEDLQPQQ